jgi:hypothetical protein
MPDATHTVPGEGWPDEELLGFLPLDRDDCDQI